MDRIVRARTRMLVLAVGVAVAAPLGLAGPIGCGDTREDAALPEVSARGAEETAPQGSEATNPAFEERRAYEARLREQLDEIGQEIADLRETAKESGGEALAATADVLESARQQASAKLDALHDASEDRWRDLRDDLDRSIDDLERRYDEAAARI